MYNHKKITQATIIGWLTSFPALRGRDELILKLQEPTREAQKFRNDLFKRLMLLDQILFIPNSHAALHILNDQYKTLKSEFIERWEYSLGYEDHKSMCQAVSCIIDTYKEIKRLILQDSLNNARQARI